MNKPRPQRAHFRLVHRLRVRWAEVDMQKIVFNPHYLTYFDTAMGDYWRALACPYEVAMQQLGGELYMKKVGVEYHASARYDDQLDIGLQCERVGNSSMQFRGGIFRGEQLLVEGELIYVYADPVTQRAKPVPPSLRDMVTAYEAGEHMTELRLGAWAQLGNDARLVRTEVFLQEQRIPVELEWDADDATALHAVVYNRMGMPVATARLVQQGPQRARVGRMAVTRVLRGGGLGRELLQLLVGAAAQRGDHEVMLHAQRSAEGFYARQGFAPRGQPFEEAGITHIEMMRPLRSPA